MGIPEGKQRKKRPEKIFEEKIAENFPITREKKQSTKSRKQRVPGRRNPRRSTPTPRHSNQMDKT